MDTSNPGANPSHEKKWKATARDRKRANLAKDKHAGGLMGHYGLSVHEPITSPLLGVQRFQLKVYNNEYQQVSKLTVPSLDYLSQDLGFAEHSGYEAISQLEIAAGWKTRLLHDALRRGKQELKGYLRRLRPLLMERGIYLYCLSPFVSLKRDVDSGLYTPDKGEQSLMPLSALPTSVDEAVLWGCSRERIEEELAPQVAWLIPMLVQYRRVKLTNELQAAFDGWLECLNPQQKEQMHTSIVRYAPYLITDQVTALLLPKWLKGLGGSDLLR